MKKIILFTFIFMCFGYSMVNAEEIINYNGVKIEEDKYNSLVSIYGNNYIDFLTAEEYNMIKNNDLSKIKINEYSEPSNFVIAPLGTTYSTSYKTITIINNSGTITLKLKWAQDPKVRSYDVIGIRFDGPTLNGGVVFRQYYRKNGELKSSTTSVKKEFSNGFGLSFMLPSGERLESTITFNVKGNGKVYGTYQHAVTDVTLNESKSYSISYLGLGKVLKYSDSISSKYDRMSGVDISI